MIAVKPGKRWTYVVDADKGLPAEQQTRFILRSLSFEEVASIDDLTIAMPGQAKLGSREAMILKLGVAGWENLKDENGEIIPYQTDENGQIKESLLDYLIPVRSELAAEIWRANFLTPEEKKRLHSQPTS